VLCGANAIVVFMCVELMLNSVNLTLVTFARPPARSTARSWRSSSWSSPPPRSVIGLAIIMSIYRTRRSASVDDANLLKY
jgi:NADH-quinone oxidoreductase subunit K